MRVFKNIFNKIKNLRRRTKVIGIIIILVLIFFVSKGQKKPATLTYQTVQENNIASQISASGILSGKNTATLHFNQAGKLNYLGVKNGDAVLKGQVIATLDATTQNAAYQQALNNRRNTQANVDYVHDQVKDHSGDETFAEKAARTAAEVANDNAYDSTLAAKKALDDTVIYSPISGVIVAQGKVSVGQNITGGDLIATVADFSAKRFEATVDESDIGSVQIGQDAQVTLNAYGDTVFAGKVAEIESTTETDSTGSITITVKIELTDPRISNIYGLNGNVNITTNSKQNVLTITQDALIDETHVYVRNPASAKATADKREIQTGIKSDTEVEVISGLSQGEQVVTNPQDVKI